MYVQFYGFRDLPFRITPDPRLLYRNACYEEAAAALAYGIEHRKGFLSLVGEAGTGKTTLLRHLLESLPAQTRTVLLLHPTVGFDEVLEYILQELGVPTEGARKLTLLQRLHEFLLEHTRAGGNVALLIDEAQDLDAVVLEELRLLSNLETGSEKILQILLAGQPELEDKLGQAHLRQLRQRIAMHVRLRPLAHDEVIAYVRARLAAVGGPDDVFTPEALTRIADVCHGIPRIVNVLCDACLVTGVALGSKQVTRAIVDEAWADYDRLLPPSPGEAAAPAPSAPPAVAPVPASIATPDVSAAGSRPPAPATNPPDGILPASGTPTTPPERAAVAEATPPAGGSAPADAPPRSSGAASPDTGMPPPAGAPSEPVRATPAFGGSARGVRADAEPGVSPAAAPPTPPQATTAHSTPAPPRRSLLLRALGTVLGLALVVAGIAAYAVAAGLIRRPTFVPPALLPTAEDLLEEPVSARGPAPTPTTPAPPGAGDTAPTAQQPATATPTPAAEDLAAGGDQPAQPAPAPQEADAPAPVAGAPDTPPADRPTVADAPPTPDEALALVQAFRLAYEDRDVERLMDLFAPDATENERAGTERIAAAYREAFSHIDRVRYTLEQPRVTPGGDRIVVAGTFLVRYAQPPAGQGELRGTATWEIARRDGRPRITSLRWALAPRA